MAHVLKCDSAGRLHLAEALRRRYGVQFLVIEALSELILVPVPEDGPKALREATRALRGRRLSTLKAAIEKQADEEAS